MPEIREYRSQVGTPGPVDRRNATPDEFGAGIARSLGRARDTLIDVASMAVDSSTRREKSDIAAKMAKAQADFTTRQEEILRTAPPGDTTISEKFLQEYDEYMDQMSREVSTVGGRRYFEENNAQMRGHFAKGIVAGQAELQGIKAKSDFESAQRYRGAALLKDPSGFQVSVDALDKQLNELVADGVLPTALAEEARTKGKIELARDSIRGWIQLDPDGTKKEIETGKWDAHLSPELKHQLYGEAEQEIRGRRAEKRQYEEDQKRQKEEQREVVRNKLLEKLVDGKLTPKDILRADLDAFGSGSKNQFLSLLEAKQRDDEANSPAFRSALKDIWKGDLRDENVLMEKAVNGELSYKQMNTLRAELQGRRSEAGRHEAELKEGVIDIAEGLLTKSNPMAGIRDPKGDIQLQKFMAFFLNEYGEQRKAGKSALELLDPDSKDYLGKHIRRFVRTPEQIALDLDGNFLLEDGTPFGPPEPEGTPSPSPTPPSKPSAPPRQEGESAAAYLERLKKEGK